MCGTVEALRTPLVEGSKLFHANSRNKSKGMIYFSRIGLKIFEGRFTLRGLYHPGWMIDGHCYTRSMLQGLGGFTTRATQASRAMSMCDKFPSTTSFTTWRTHWDHYLACPWETLVQLKPFLSQTRQHFFWLVVSKTVILCMHIWDGDAHWRAYHSDSFRKLKPPTGQLLIYKIATWVCLKIFRPSPTMWWLGK